MSYKNLLKKQIEDLQKQIEQKQGDKATLEAQLTKLMVAEFEEDMATENTQTLLKGQYPRAVAWKQQHQNSS